DHMARNKAFVPGPGSYETPDLHGFPLPEGGRVNRKAPNQVERVMFDESPSPAPGAYGVPSDPNKPRNVYGKFSRDPRVTKFIEDETKRTKHIPGPGAHYVQESLESLKPFCPEGGRYLDAHKPAGYFDVAPKIWENNPPPASYDLPGSLQVKSVGRTVYRYESATIDDTKALITKVVGQRNEAPGPGTYKVPDPAPLGGAPSLKGRQLPHSMPHPYAYNCAPDHSRSYLSLAPVRASNNAEQIFGNGWKQGEAAQASKRAGASSGNQQVPLSDLPTGIGEEEKGGGDDGAVQWRSGGFSNLKKSRSASAIRGPKEHPSVEAMSHHYPKLSQKHRGNSTFLPMSSRRSEKLATHDTSEENVRFESSKWKLKAVMEGIQNATAAVLEPLDVDKLKLNAMYSLRDKAVNRMKLQGVSREQQEVILEEMGSLMQERSVDRQVFDGQPLSS
ncbi:unnamed protein product, partial [Polarella glacialis]